MVARRKSESVRARNERILRRIREIKADFPWWGYRRVWAYLKYREGLEINKKRVYSLMKENKLLVNQVRKTRATRTPSRSKPRTERPNELWGIDATKVWVESWGWVNLHVVLDWGSKKIVGWQLSRRTKTDDWL
jgi:Integrase core domain.